jgi:SpoVK/Ycf46/Vps4 family AAA+-type ATPase
MSKGHFKISSKKKLSEMEPGQELSTSDYATLTPDGYFVQMEYVETDDTKDRIPTHVKPGIFSMKKSMAGMFLQETEFSKDRILEGFVETKFIEERVDKFFEKIGLYRELEIENIKRSMLITGRPGMGKSTMINKTSTRYGQDKQTLVLVWHTDIFEAGEVKNFVQSFEYEKHGVTRMILVVEDLGGGTMEGSRRPSDSSLLSILDNKEKTFKVPVFILATTNNPEMFQENVMDRPERFDDVMEAPAPSAEARAALLKFFAKNYPVQPEALEKIKSTACKEMSPAHIREVVMRGLLYDKTQLEVIEELLKHSKAYSKGFAKQTGGVGFGAGY